jgi:hypothetical protein
MRYIGISGKSMSGKTTVAKHLQSVLEDTIIWGFGHEVKYAFMDEYGMWSALNLRDITDLDLQEVKNRVLPNGKTVRDELVRIGLQEREGSPDVWVDRWKQRMKNEDFLDGFEVVVAPDVRFPNEVQAIKDLGGITIRLTRNPDDIDVPTETSLDEFKEFDFHIVNQQLTIEETNMIASQIVSSLFRVRL